MPLQYLKVCLATNDDCWTLSAGYAGDNLQQVAQTAATQTIRSSCAEDAAAKANQAAIKSAKAAAHLMAEKVILDTIKEEEEAKTLAMQN